MSYHVQSSDITSPNGIERLLRLVINTQSTVANKERQEDKRPPQELAFAILLPAVACFIVFVVVKVRYNKITSLRKLNNDMHKYTFRENIRDILLYGRRQRELQKSSKDVEDGTPCAERPVTGPKPI